MAYRSTPAGEHVPVMLPEVLQFLDPQAGEIAVDCTLGAAGHSIALLERVGPEGKLIAMDSDQQYIESGQTKLSAMSNNFELHLGNFAGIAQLLPDGADLVLADLGVSSMQIDDPQRGFSYRRDGPLDMRMDARRGRSAAELLQSMPANELVQALRELGDFDEFGYQTAEKLADAMKRAGPATTRELSELILQTVPPPAPPPGKFVKPWQLKYRPVACVFQTLRILVNRELANLAALLRSLPQVLRPGGRVAVISFHSGEDRLVKQAFRDGLRTGIYSAVADDAIRASYRERQSNPRSRSAKLRWARKTKN